MRWLAVSAVLIACSSTPRPGPDAAIDGGPDVCQTCRTGEICVAKYDGVCEADVRCMTRVVDCPANACTASCEAAYCTPSPYQCQTRSPCGGESPLAFTCYGP